MEFSRDLLNFTGGLTDRLMTRIPDFLLQKSTLSRDEYLTRLRFYADWDEEQPFFVLPDSPPSAEPIETLPYGDSGKRVLYRYPSRFVGHNPALRSELAQHTNNQSGYLHLWRHDESGTRPLVLCVHGFGMAGPRRAEAMFKIRRLFELGLDVALHHLPHHWRRSDAAPNNPFLRPEDVPATLEEWVRNVHDLHSAVLLLQRLGYGRIGLIGASLGGLTGALYATRPVPLEFAFFVVPATDLRDFLAPRASRMRFAPDAEVTEATLAALRRITPAHYQPGLEPRRMAIVAHEGDLICPVRYTRELVARWDIPHYTEVVGGHWVYLDRKTRGRVWYGWLASAGFLSPRA